MSDHRGLVPMSPDVRRILWAQGLRAWAYGLGAVLLGATLDRRGFSSAQAGLVLAAVVAGTVAASLTVGRWGDRWGRRRCYAALYVALAVCGVVYALSSALPLLLLVALTGALSTEVVESGPFTSLEQSMLAADLSGRERVRGFGVYNAVAAAAGSVGALAAGGLGPLRDLWPALSSERAFLLFVPVALAGAVIALRLSADVEVVDRRARRTLERSRRPVLGLSALFATDAFGGGFVVQSFIAFWLTDRFGATLGQLGVLFFAMGVLQTLSFLAAPRLAERFGLLQTMVFTHLPSNVLLGALAFAPSLPVAVALLLGRVTLSQMDVPTRQAYVMALVDPSERTAAAAWTNTARYVARPAGPALAGVLQSSLAAGAPFLLAGTIKGIYDLVLWGWFRGVALPEDGSADTV